MERKTIFYLFIGSATAIALYLTYLVFKPFLTPILLGLIFSVALNPVYLRLLELTGGRKIFASLGICLIITFIIVIPLIYLTAVLASEITATYSHFERIIQTGDYRNLLPFLDYQITTDLYTKLNLRMETFQIDIKEVFLGAAKDISSYSVYLLTGAIKNTVYFIINLFFMLFTVFYLCKDSDLIAEEVKYLIPLTDIQKGLIYKRLKDIIYATLYGSLASALAQGFLGWLAFWVLDINSPVLWGVVMGLLALAPIGASIIWFPASLLLLLQGSYVKAAILFLWGGMVISLIDNLIRQLLMSGRGILHPLVTLFGVIGGLIVFGPIGIFAGPFVVAMFLILLDIAREVSEPERTQAK